MILQLDCLSKAYGSKRAIDCANASFESGVYGLLGTNGSGKTTLMRMICGILRPTSGEVLLDGVDVGVLDAEYRDMLGYLPQDLGFYPDFTALNFMRYIGTLKGIDKKQIRTLALDLLEQVGLQENVNSKIKTFSGGMKQRLGIAQAIINDPTILILDEPTAGLDPQERVRFRNLISNLSKDRIVILSTHIVSDVEHVANEILIMKKGAFILQGAPTMLAQAIEGKVWEVKTTPHEAAVLSSTLCVGNIYHADTDTTVLRIVSDKKPAEDAQPLRPTLEDLYLFVARDEAGQGRLPIDEFGKATAKGGSHD